MVDKNNIKLAGSMVFFVLTAFTIALATQYHYPIIYLIIIILFLMGILLICYIQANIIEKHKSKKKEYKL